MLWSGRFSKQLDKKILDFTSSLDLDTVLYKYDIKGSLAHAKGLLDVKILKQTEFNKITQSLKKIEKEIDNGKFLFTETDEDIHMAIERRLTGMIGQVGKKIHTGRSRNDQVSLDMRMYLKDILRDIDSMLCDMIKAFKKLAEKNIDVVMPGYTHLQQAQPVLFSQYLLAYISMFLRDKDRFGEAHKRCDVFPLGAGALAGTPYAIDRFKIAKILGFSKITTNSMDTVSDRDFILDFLYASSVFVMHCTRLSEDFIIWSSQEFGFIELDDAYTTGSSIMPQKKNPDVLELMRGRSERVISSLNAFLNLMKGLPMTYNRDMQEDKYYLLSSLNVVMSYLDILPRIILTLKVRKDKMKKSLEEGYIYATGIADYLVNKNVPFRDAHSITGQIVAYAISKNKKFKQLSIEEFKQFSKYIKEDILKIFDPLNIINFEKTQGSTSLSSVKKQLKKV